MSDFIIKYSGPATEGGFDMAVIGESMVGFNSLLKDFYKACGIDGELQVRTTDVKPSSVIVTGQLIAEITNQLITNPELFIDAVKLVDTELWRQLSGYLSTVGNADRGINDFFQERPFTSNVVSGAIASVPGLMLAWWLDKRKTGDVNNNMSKLEQKIASLQQQKRFNKALKALQENGYDSITYSAEARSGGREVTVRDDDLGNILPEDEKILPDYEDGVRFVATCQIKSLSSSRGEKVGVSFYDVKFGQRIYTAFPDDNHTSASYRNLYGERVSGEFEVFRKSLYKVPEFKIISLERIQSEFGLGNDE